MSHKKKFIFVIIIFICLIGIISISKVSNAKKVNTEKHVVDNKDLNPIVPEKKENPWDKYYKNNVDLKSVREKYDNYEIVAELYVPDLFDVYIANHGDNDYYLDHNLYRKYDIKGAEYMDYRVNVHSRQINIYGHNSQTFNIPFRKLEKMLKKDFFDSHPYMILSYDEGEAVYEVISVKEVSTDHEHMKVNVDNMKDHIDHLKKDSIYTRDVEYDENSNILVLQTCSFAHKNHYYVFTAVEIDKK